MKEIIFILLFLYSFSNEKYKINILPFYPDLLRLMDSTLNYTYMAFDLGLKKQPTLYFCFRDESYGLYKPSFCITTEDVWQDSTIDNCIFNDLDLYDTVISDKKIEYYLKGSTTNTINKNLYMVVRYSGVNTEGLVWVRNSWEEIKYSNKLSTSTIILIVGGCLCFLSIAIPVIQYIYRVLKYRYKKKNNMQANNNNNLI